LSHLLTILLALAFSLVLGAQCFLARFFRFFASLLELSQSSRAPLPATQIAMGLPQQISGQLESASDLERVAHSELPDPKMIRRPQRFHIELYSRIFRM